MGRKRFIAEQIIVNLREVEIIKPKGLTQLEVAKKLSICEKTLIHWRKEFDCRKCHGILWGVRAKSMLSSGPVSRDAEI